MPAASSSSAAPPANTGAAFALAKRPGADLDAADERGRTAMLEAAERGHTDVVELLLEAVADPGLAARDVLFQPELVVRASTGG